MNWTELFELDDPSAALAYADWLEERGEPSPGWRWLAGHGKWAYRTSGRYYGWYVEGARDSAERERLPKVAWETLLSAWDAIVADVVGCHYWGTRLEAMWAAAKALERTGVPGPGKG